MLALAQLTWVHIAYASYMLRVQLVARVFLCVSLYWCTFVNKYQKF